MKATTKDGTTIEGTQEEITKTLRELEQGEQEREIREDRKPKPKSWMWTAPPMQIEKYSPTFRKKVIGRESSRKYSPEIYDFIKNNYLNLGCNNVRIQIEKRFNIHIPGTSIDGIYRRIWGCGTVGEARQKQKQQFLLLGKIVEKEIYPQSNRKMKYSQEVYDFIEMNTPAYGVTQISLLLEKKFGFGVHKTTINSIFQRAQLRRWEQTGGYKSTRQIQPQILKLQNVVVEPNKIMRGRKSRLDQNAVKFLLRNFAQHTNDELQKLIKEKFGVEINTPIISGWGARYNIKKLPEVKKRKDEERYLKVQQTFLQKKLPDHKICVDCNKVFRRTEFKSAWKYYISKYCKDCGIKVMLVGRKFRKKADYIEKIITPKLGEIKVESYDGLPNVENVSVDKIILGGIIRNVIKNRTQITFNGESYSLDIDNINAWKDFVIDFMAKSGQIADYFGVPNKFVRGGNWEIKYAV